MKRESDVDVRGYCTTGLMCTSAEKVTSLAFPWCLSPRDGERLPDGAVRERISGLSKPRTRPPLHSLIWSEVHHSSCVQHNHPEGLRALRTEKTELACESFILFY
ncbi:hypothetical protein DNTS_009414 [Danionella cerebrum]|uniref:Uncharacterized protein n=1 Tax=Danionella cerebrum TaxID=2873325 RepID=A0A553NIA3_9TELE|nr:hypothetical protein DNTS_009414 [Danionella translucida]